ncbi:unnamed protein product [Cercospora beticola]|nr:unnamed protein product [Cercospora beticola]
MKFTTRTTLLATAIAAPALAAEYAAEMYASGEIHSQIMETKHAQWDADQAAGRHDPGAFTSWKNWPGQLGLILRRDPVRCENGLAVVEPLNPLQTFRCQNMDFYDFISHRDMGSLVGEGSSSWGWRARNGREFGLIGQFDGTAFVEVKRNGKLEYIGRLPSQNPVVDRGQRWREIRVLGDRAIIGSEAVNHNVQIFDLNQLLDVDPSSPRTFSTTDDVTIFSDTLPRGRTHNVVVDWDTNTAMAVGAAPRNLTCNSGLQYFDPANPGTSPGCADQDGYVHDAQCVIYNGPDRRFRGRNICIGYNEDTVTVYDSTSRTGNPGGASEVLSRLSYPGATYCHQGWWTERNWHQFVLLNDELDEQNGVGPGASGRPVTHIIDFSDLRNPKATGTFFATDHKAIDHNLYIVDGLTYQSNYGSGIWVHDTRSISRDPTGNSVTTHAFFDIYPEDDAVGGRVAFVGTWSHFLFPSGFVLVNTIERGAFVVKIARGRGSGRGRGHGGPSRG